jgi:hypothetical protein
MGTWGSGLYDDDTASDVRDRYLELLREGLTDEESTAKIKDEFTLSFRDETENAVVWFALADTQWRLGRLLPDVKKAALNAIEEGSNLGYWETENPRAARSREKELIKLKERICAPMRAPVKLRKTRQYLCEWKPGDTFAYELVSESAKRSGVKGEYLIFRKVDEIDWLKDRYPIVYVQMTAGRKLPGSKEEIELLPYLPTSLTPPADEHISKKELTQYGEWVFRQMLMISSRKEYEKRLAYLGNFPVVRPPMSEYIYGDKQNTRMIALKDLERAFEYPWLADYIKAIR